MTTVETHIPQRFNAIEDFYEPHSTFISSTIQQHHEDDAWVQSSSSESESISEDDEMGAHSKDTKRNKRSSKKADSDDERPKKRGKTPKKKSSSPDSEYIPINQYQPNVNSVNIQQQGSPLLRKKKRGRPPKKKPEEGMMDPSMIKQDTFSPPSGTTSMVTVGSDGKLYASNPPSANKNGILQMMPHPLASIPSSALPTPVQAPRSSPACFYDKCTLNTTKRSPDVPESPNPTFKPLILHPKFDNQIRGCKKHFEKWKAQPMKPGACELCRGLNMEGVPDSEHSKYVQIFVNTKNQQFQLCNVCSHKQATLLGLVAAPKATKMEMIENNLAMNMTMAANAPESESESPDSDSDSDSSDSSSDSSSSSESDSDSSKDTETVKSSTPKIKKKKGSSSSSASLASSVSVGSVTYTVYKSNKPAAGWETFGKGVTYSTSLQYEEQSKPVPAALSITYIDTEPAPFQVSIRKRANSADGALFADTDIVQGVCIGEFTGKVSQAKKKQKRKFAFIIVDADIEIDASLIGNEMRFISDLEGNIQPNVKFELTDGHVVCVTTRNISKGEELYADYGSGHLRDREIFYLETFEKIKHFNEENLIGEEKSHAAFDWFLNEGWSLLKQKAKVTVPIDHRLPAKKGLANNFKTAKSFSNSSVKNPLEWGYVAQLEKLDLVRAREDCWVTFKAGKHWNYDAFRNALSLWRIRSPNHHYVPSAPSPSVPKKKHNNNLLLSQSQSAQPPIQNLAHSQTTGQSNASPQPQSSQGYSQTSQGQPQAGFVSSLFANATTTGQNRDRERENNSNNNNNPNNNNTHVNPATQFKQDKKAATQALLRANKIPQTAAIHLVTRCQLEEIKFSDLSIKFETSLLGSSKHGYVFKGYWRGFPVAVRFPSLKSQITFEERQKFIRECNQTAVYHPNVVTSYAACVTDQLCLAMEFMNLGNLKQWLIRTSPHVHAMYLSRIALDVARAMDFIHYKGLVHSRLHSNNVLLKGEILDHGGLIAGFEVKVSDIGPPPTEDYYYATTLHEQHIDPTPFVSPELLQSKRFTKQSDVFAFGMILCHLFSEGTDEPKSVQEVLQTAHYLQLWDMKWKELILRCTHKNVEQRPSFTEIVDILSVLHLNTTRM